MKKTIIIAVVAALVLCLGVTAYAVNNNRTSQPDTTQGEQFPAEAPQMDGEKPSDLPEMNGQPPQMNGEAPSGLPEMNGQPPQMNGEAPSGLPEMNGQPPQMNGETPSGLPEMNGQPPQMNDEAPSGLPEMNREHPANGGLLNDLLSNGIITQAEYDALSESLS